MEFMLHLVGCFAVRTDGSWPEFNDAPSTSCLRQALLRAPAGQDTITARLEGASYQFCLRVDRDEVLDTCWANGYDVGSGGLSHPALDLWGRLEAEHGVTSLPRMEPALLARWRDSHGPVLPEPEEEEEEDPAAELADEQPHQDEPAQEWEEREEARTQDRGTAGGNAR